MCSLAINNEVKPKLQKMMDKKQTLLGASSAISFVYKIAGGEMNTDFAGRINAKQLFIKLIQVINKNNTFALYANYYRDETESDQYT